MQEIDLEHVILDTIPIPNPAAICRETYNDTIILVNCDTGGTLSLNGTGRLIWNLIDGKRDPQAITKKLRESFSNVPDCISDDVTSFLSLLSEDGFVGYEIKQ